MYPRLPGDDRDTGRKSGPSRIERRLSQKVQMFGGAASSCTSTDRGTTAARPHLRPTCARTDGAHPRGREDSEPVNVCASEKRVPELRTRTT